MGAQIAALAANAGLRVDLLDLPDGDDPAGRARGGVEGLASLRPPALYLPELAASIRPGSLDDTAVLGKADWIIEAVVEDLDTKRSLLERVTSHIAADAVISSNTPGCPSPLWPPRVVPMCVGASWASTSSTRHGT